MTDLLEAARDGHMQALALLPPDYHDYRAIAHNQLGGIYRELKDLPRALSHYQHALRHREANKDAYAAGITRFDMALLRAGNSRANDALHYARAALSNFQGVGSDAATAVARAADLIEELELSIASHPS